MRFWLLVILCSCQVVKSAGGEVGGHLAEWIACPTELVDCGHVYMCDAPAENDLEHVEICVNDDAFDGVIQIDSAETLYGHCDLTPRHEGLCIWCCGPDCGRGCNAFNGCFCP